MPKQVIIVDGEDAELVLKDISWESVKYIDRLNRDLVRLQNHLSNLNGDATEEEIDEAEKRLEIKMGQIQAAMGKNILQIPRSWLAEDAPPDDKLNFADGSALNYVKRSAMRQIILATNGEEADTDAKNSRKQSG